MNIDRASKIAFMDFGGHLILNMLEYQDISPSKRPRSKNSTEKEQKKIQQKVSSEIPF
ncbi:hypothetical protein [Brevibacillus choshinensis]|uniref:Transposase n=1 Tax=Brevibacillus choshinensis TaxID=54911 RepID=A0ABX7FX40_BRECH|nr:hypothetical protein [Brevibacillus choshinensis]QRG70370.1 hypothetical protein JNE38_15405 [Brevibacillus choshinensis]